MALLVIVATLGSVAYYCWEAWPTTAGKRGLLPLGSVAYYYGDKYIIVSSPAFCKFNPKWSLETNLNNLNNFIHNLNNYNNYGPNYAYYGD